MGEGSEARGATHSPVSHLWDDVVSILVVCTKRGVVSRATWSLQGKPLTPRPPHSPGFLPQR